MEGATQSSPTAIPAEASSTTESSGVYSAAQADEPGPPFQGSDLVPAGSLLTIRLKTTLIANNGSQQSFEGFVDDPVVVQGTTLIPRDALISGEVESAHVFSARPDRDYVRLTLNSLQVDGLSVPIETSTLFVRHPAAATKKSPAIRLEAGRRLTFRLKEQVFLHSNISKRGQ